jgi:dUTP pyrophosphatase
MKGENMENKIKVGFKKVHPEAKLPTYAHEGDAGMDVYAAEDIKLKPYVPAVVHTGLVAEIPEGYELQVRSRSGLAAKHGISVLNSPGTIDQGYKGEIGVVLFWAPPIPNAIYCSRDDCGVHVKADYITHSVLKGDRIAQLVLSPVTTCAPVEVQDVSETERGSRGFGSTGI